MPKRSADYLVWIDMEMSGLDPDRDVILEIATLITDEQLQLIAEGPVFAVRQPKRILDRMDRWNTEHHNASGLVKRVLESEITATEAEHQTLAFVRKYCLKRKSPLCGNSVYQDRRFLAHYMPELENFLHYRNIDVSTIKELVRRWYPNGAKAPEKKHAHLALDDIRESIEELRFYREQYFPKGDGK